MAVSVEAAFILLDKASGTLKSIEAQARKTDLALKGMGSTSGPGPFAKLAADSKSATSAMDKVSSSSDKLGRSLLGARRELDSQGKVIETISGRFTGLRTALANTATRFGNLRSNIANSTREFTRAHPEVQKLTTGIAGLGGAAKNMLIPFGLIPSAIFAALPALQGMVGLVGALTGSLAGAVGGGVAIGGGVLGSFVVGLGSVAAVAKPAITQLTNYRTAVTNLNKAMQSGDPKQIQSAQQAVNQLAKQTPGVAGLSRELTGFSSTWKKVTAPGQAAFFKMAGEAVGDLRKQLGWLGPEANSNMKAVADAFHKQLEPFITGSAFRGMVTNLGSIFRGNLPGLVRGLTNVLTGLSNIFVTLRPQLLQVGDGFASLTDRFKKWTASAKGESTISAMGASFKEWLRLLGGISRILGAVLGAGMRTGTSTVSKWADSVQKFADMLSGPKGQKTLTGFFQQAMDQAGKLWPVVKDVAKTVWDLYQAWKPLGDVYLKVLDTASKLIGLLPAPVLQAALVAVVGAKAIGGARKVASGVSKAFNKFERGESPTTPLYVMDVSSIGGGLGGGGKEGGIGGIRGRFAETRVGKWATGTSLGGKLLTREGEAVNFGKGARIIEGGGGLLTPAVSTAEKEAPGLLSKLGDLLKHPSGFGKGAGALGGIGGLTGGLGGMTAMMALPALSRLVPKGLRESGVGKSLGGAVGGFMSGGFTGAGIMGLSALLPGLARTKAGQGIAGTGMAAATGSTLGTLAGVLAPASTGLGETILGSGVLGVTAGGGIGALGMGGLKAGSYLRNKVGGMGGRLASIGTEAAAGAGIGAIIGNAPGAAIGGAIGGAVGTAQAYNPFSAKGRSNIAADAKTTWNGIKTGATATANFVAKTAVKYNPFSASGQKNIAHAAVTAYNGAKQGAVTAANAVAKTAVKFNPFSASGRKNIVNGAKSAWGGVKTAFGAAGKWFAGVGKSIAHPFVSAFNWVKNAGKNTWNWLKGAASNVVKSIGNFFTKTPLGQYIMWPFKTAYNWVKNRFNDLIGFFKGLPGKIGNALKNIGDAITSPFKKAFNWVKDHMPKISMKSHKVLGVSVPLPSIHLAQGGVVPRTAPVLVGEAGPEIVHLPAGSRVIPNHQLGNVVPQYAAATGTPSAITAGAAGVAAVGAGAMGGGGANFQKVLANTSKAMQLLVKQSQQISAVFRGLSGALNRVESELAGRGGLVNALNRTESEFVDFRKQGQTNTNQVSNQFKDLAADARKWLTQMQTDSKWLMDQLNQIMPPNMKTISDTMTKYMQQLDKNMQQSWKSIIFNVNWGIGQIFKAMANAFKTMGASAPKGIAAAAKGKARGGRLPGEPRGDHIPLVSRGGEVMAMADGGELVVNRHTESRVDSKLARFGTSLGQEVAGETRPHNAPKRAKGGRVPRLATGGVVGQVDSFFSSKGYNKVAIAGILGNAMQESGLNPNTAGGGMWQQISNFGQGTGGSLEAQMERMLPQIVGFRGQLNAAGSPGAAAQIFEQQFERAGIPAMANRIRYAQAAYAGKLGSISGGAAMGDGGAVVTAPKIKIPKLNAPGAIGALGQGAVNKVGTAGQSKLDATASSMSGGGPGGAPGPAPMTGPKAVQAMIKEANQIASHRYNYEWGGGHGAIGVPGHGSGHGSGPGVGFDCSGSVSAVLHAAGLLNTPMTSGPLMTWGDPGPGKAVSIFASPVHVFMELNGHYFGTSGMNPGGGAGWIPHFPEAMPATRHPPGLAKGGRMTRKGGDGHRDYGVPDILFGELTRDEQRRQQKNPYAILPDRALGGRIPWFAEGTDFIAKRPTIIGVGDNPTKPERVTVTPQSQGGAGNRPLHIEIHNIQVNRKGDVQKIVDEEMRLLAGSIEGRL